MRIGALLYVLRKALVMQQEIGEIRYSSALIVATIFKVLATLFLAVTALAAIAGGISLARATDFSGFHQYSGGAVAGYVAGIVAMGLTMSGLLWFCAYVLEILVGTYTQLWHVRYGEDDGDEG